MCGTLLNLYKVTDHAVLSVSLEGGREDQLCRLSAHTRESPSAWPRQVFWTMSPVTTVVKTPTGTSGRRQAYRIRKRPTYLYSRSPNKISVTPTPRVMRINTIPYCSLYRYRSVQNPNPHFSLRFPIESDLGIPKIWVSSDSEVD